MNKGPVPMSNIDVAKETIKITEAGAYEVNGRKVVFSKEEHTGVTVYTPEDGAKLLEKYAAIPQELHDQGRQLGFVRSST